MPNSTHKSIAIIADIVGSRELKEKRFEAQEKLNNALNSINETYSNDIASKFLITVGDEFQGLLKHGIVIPDIVWDLEKLFTLPKLRFGIGCGIIVTKPIEYSIGMDGPVWYKARDAIELAKKNRLLGGVFKGFDNLDTDDRIINGLSRLLYHQRKSLTDKQKKIFELLRLGYEQVEIGKELNIPKQNVSRTVATIGWKEYSEGEEALKCLLKQYDFRKDW